MAKSTDAPLQAHEPPVPIANMAAAECGCQWRGSPHHDALLLLESDWCATAQLVEMAVTWDEMPPDDENPFDPRHPAEFHEFAKLHNWQDPLAVASFGHGLSDIHRYHRQSRNLVRAVAVMDRVARSVIGQEAEYAYDLATDARRAAQALGVL
jgi:hypothetical protein